MNDVIENEPNIFLRSLRHKLLPLSQNVQQTIHTNTHTQARGDGNSPEPRAWVVRIHEN